MKYHGHIIKKVYEPLLVDPEMQKDQCVYEIYKDNKFLAMTICLGCAKEYIDSNYNETYLV